jgi:hypothetical protein
LAAWNVQLRWFVPAEKREHAGEETREQEKGSDLLNRNKNRV